MYLIGDFGFDYATWHNSILAIPGNNLSEKKQMEIPLALPRISEKLLFNKILFILKHNL